MTSPILEVRDLVKSYKRAAAPAVDGLSFDVRAGTCFGLLGPNGAGKTTTIEMMEGILDPDSGEILFRGAPIGRPASADYRRSIGIQFQQTALPNLLTTKEVIELFSMLYPKRLPLEELVERCQLKDFLDREPRRLSGGQRQRVLLALAIVNDPDLIFLDEPTTGLDPQARRNFWDLVRDIRALGKTLVLTTHYMEEAEFLCDEIAIVDRGRLIARGEPGRLIRESFSGSILSLPQASFDRSPGDRWKSDRDRWHLETTDVGATLAQLVAAGQKLEGLQVVQPTLEDLFIKLTGKSLRE